MTTHTYIVIVTSRIPDIRSFKPLLLEKARRMPMPAEPLSTPCAILHFCRNASFQHFNFRGNSMYLCARTNAKLGKCNLRNVRTGCEVNAACPPISQFGLKIQDVDSLRKKE